MHAAAHDGPVCASFASAVKQPSVGACAVTGALIFFLPVVVTNYDQYEGSDVIFYGGSVLALVGAALGTFVGLLIRFLRQPPRP